MSADITQAAGEVAHQAVQASVAGTLGLNLKLFIAQLVNFAIVLVVVWKWVYTPLLKIIEERQSKIQKGIKDAETATKNLAEVGKKTALDLKKARTEAQAIIETARAEAEAIKKETLTKTQAEVSQVVATGKARLNQEKNKMLVEAKKDVAELVLLATEKVLQKTLDKKTQAVFVEEAVKQVEK